MPLFMLNASALHRGTVFRTASSSLHKSLYIRIKNVDESPSLQQQRAVLPLVLGREPAAHAINQLVLCVTILYFRQSSIRG